MPVTRFRDLQSPVGVGVFDNDTGAADLSRQLSDSFRSFSRLASDVVGGIRAEQGAREGEAAGAAGTPAPRSGLRAATAYGQAYNTAAEAAYVAKIHTDIDSSISEIEQNNQANLEAYSKIAQDYSDKLLTEVSPEYRVRVQQTLAVRVADGHTRVRGQEIAWQKEANKVGIIESAPARINEILTAAIRLPPEQADAAMAAGVADFNEQIETLVADGSISPVEAVKFKAAFVDDLDTGLFNMQTDEIVKELLTVGQANLSNSDEMFRAMMDDPDFSDETKAEIRNKYRAARAALTEDRGHQYFDRAATLYQRIAADEFGPAVENEALRLRNLGGLDDTEYRSVLTKSQENALKVKDRTDAVRRVELALQGLGLLDPGSAADRQAVSEYVNDGVARLGLAPGTERWTATMTDVVRNTGILPEQAESWARASMTTGDPARAALGAAFYERVRQTNPAAWDYNKDPKVASFATQLNSNMTNLGDGADPISAYNLAFKSVYGTSEDEKKVFQQSYTENKARLAENASFLVDALDADPNFNPAWSPVGLPDMTGRGQIELQARFNNLVSQYFLDGGNIDHARKTAAAHLLSRTGVTAMNGVREIVDLAPERIYPEMTAEIIRADLTATLKAIDPTINPDRIRIQPSGDGATAETRGMIWGLGLLNADGHADVLLGPDSRPVLYRLPAGADFVAAKAAVAAAKVAAAVEAKKKLSLMEPVGAVMGGPGLR